MSQRPVLKRVLEIPVKERKLIRRKVHNWKLNNYFRTGTMYTPSLLAPRAANINEDGMSSEEETAFVIPTAAGPVETHVQYPGATRRPDRSVTAAFTPQHWRREDDVDTHDPFNEALSASDADQPAAAGAKPAA